MKKNSSIAQIYWVGILIPFIVACHRPSQVQEGRTCSISIDDSMDYVQDSLYLQYLQQVRGNLGQQLDIVLSHAPQSLELGHPECTMVNWMADALLEEARLHFDGKIDASITNMGGARCAWNAGDITIRNIYELMPFDNELVVITLQGKDLLELCQVFAMVDGQGVSGIRMAAEDKQLITAEINGAPIMEEAYYKIATSNYLAEGNDLMLPLANSIDRWDSHMLIRDLYIEYAKNNDIVATLDGRMDVH